MGIISSSGIKHHVKSGEMVQSKTESRSVASDSLQHYGLYSPWNSPGQNIGIGSHSLLQGIFPTQGSNPGLPHCRWFLYKLSHKGSPRILEWVAYSFSRGSSWPRNQIKDPALQGLLQCRQILYQLSYQGNPSERGQSQKTTSWMIPFMWKE